MRGFLTLLRWAGPAVILAAIVAQMGAVLSLAVAWLGNRLASRRDRVGG